MFTQIGLAIKQMFTMITVLFAAGESLANATKHLADTAEFTAAAFSDDARVRRAKALAIMEAELTVVEAQPLEAAKIATKAA